MAESKTPIGSVPKAARTLLPWYIYDPLEAVITIRAHGPIVSGIVATVNTQWPHSDQREEQRANAEFIVRAVNSHDALLEALNKAIAYLTNPQAFDTDELGKDLWRFKAKAERPTE